MHAAPSSLEEMLWETMAWDRETMMGTYEKRGNFYVSKAIQVGSTISKVS
jgi:hypothetical protein